MLIKEYQELYEGYSEWLTRINYAKYTIKQKKRHLKYFLEWLEIEAIESLEEIELEDFKFYRDHLLIKRNKQGKSLSSNTIQSYIEVLKHVNKYLEKYDKPPLITKKIYTPEYISPVINPLTVEDINELYSVCNNDHVGFRDRAILSLYYGCGLRSKEGIDLLVGDIDLKNEYLQVRSGKHYLQRYVPLSKGVKSDFEDYLRYGRFYFKCEPNDHFLLTVKGTHISNGRLNTRIKQLAEKAGIEKRINLHLLRHSIATHLLAEGMELDQIQLFLGHRSIRATQHYTHVAESRK
ncbi:tyrosine-type recombinase/integrase [Portibacter lacus]|uniref:Tyrosine recombinase XerC n=1 Tax=Portibacter lacus TaxID=1099794 RepID=A0AA37SV43_9BACT|nr:tyrosine-type recombinase/integrase [Portibacter lacus]GLR20209.1 tyrosine recombinase XerC [Portibacter lacus]